MKCKIQPQKYKQYNRALLKSIIPNSQALSLFRICFALLLLFDLFSYTLPFREFVYSAQGIFTAHEDYNYTTNGISFFSYSDNIIYQNILFTAYFLALMGILIGIRTRTCCLIAYLIFISLMDRTPAVNSNIEVLMAAFLFWSCFMPLDRYWSWNAAMREPEPDNADHMKWPIIPLVAMKLQIVVVYMHSGLFKLSSGDWTSGVALKYVVRDEYYGNALGLGAIDLLPDNVLHVSTWAIIIFQLLFSFLVYFPVKNNFFRALALLGASIMHIGFAIFLQVGLFPYLCATYLILLIPDQWLNGLLKKRRKRLSNIHVYYDADCGFCKATARLFGSFCLGPAAIIEPSYANKTADGLLKKHTSWVVMSPDKHYLKWEAVSFVLKQSPIFWIFGFLTDIAFIKPLMAKVYDSIGKNRHKLSKVFGSLLRKQVEHWPDVTQQTLCLICAVLMLAYTTMTIPQSPIVPPKSLYSFLAQLKLSQKWDLFAPNIASYDREFKISMTDKSGQDIDLLPILTQLYTQDEYGYKHFSTHKILRYFDALLRKNNPRHRLGFARYICNKTQNQNPDIVTMKIYFRHKFRKDDYYISNMVFSCDDIVTKGVSR